MENASQFAWRRVAGRRATGNHVTRSGQKDAVHVRHTGRTVFQRGAKCLNCGNTFNEPDPAVAAYLVEGNSTRRRRRFDLPQGCF
jgi:hypothetical protein